MNRNCTIIKCIFIVHYRWIDGFANRFGLTYIDYKNATLPRYPKKSSKYYADYARTHYSYDSSDSGNISDSDDDSDDVYSNNDDESSGVVDTHTSNSSSSEGASKHKNKKHKKKDKKNKEKKDKGKGEGKINNRNDDLGPIIPVDDDYTLDPKYELYKGGVSAPLRDQAKRMVAVSSVGGFMDFLNAAIGSNHGAAIFGPQGLVP